MTAAMGCGAKGKGMNNTAKVHKGKGKGSGGTGGGSSPLASLKKECEVFAGKWCPRPCGQGSGRCCTSGGFRLRQRPCGQPWRRPLLLAALVFTLVVYLVFVGLLPEVIAEQFGPGMPCSCNFRPGEPMFAGTSELAGSGQGAGALGPQHREGGSGGRVRGAEVLAWPGVLSVLLAGAAVGEASTYAACIHCCWQELPVAKHQRMPDASSVAGTNCRW